MRWVPSMLGAIAAAAALAAPAPSRACSVCGCGDPLLVATDPAAIAGTLRLQLDAEVLRVDAANEADPALTDRLTQWSVRLNATWRPLDRLSLSATVPFVDKALRTAGGGATVSSSDAAGLGDVDFGARWAAWQDVNLGTGRVQELAISAGTSAPTGADDVTSNGERIDEHGQPGTGAWGPFAGLHYRFELGKWLAYASVSGRAHTVNAYGYRYGAALLWSAHGQWVPTKRLVLDLGVDGRTAAPDRDAGSVVPNTGGTALAAAPGVYWNAFGAAWLFARAQLPFYERLFGTQDLYPTVVAGVQVQLF